MWNPNGLINYKDTRAKCRHLKLLTCKGTLRLVFIRVYRLEIQSVTQVSSTQLCELWTFSLVQLFHLPPFPCVNTCTVYTPQTNKHRPQSPFTGQFFKMTTFCIAFLLRKPPFEKSYEKNSASAQFPNFSDLYILKSWIMCCISCWTLNTPYIFCRWCIHFAFRNKSEIVNFTCGSYWEKNHICVIVI